MNPADRPSAARVVALEHQLALLQVHLFAGRLPLGADLLRDIAHRVGALLGAKVAILTRQTGGWAIRAESEGEAPPPAIDPRSRFGDLVATASREAVTVVIDDREWTIAARGAQPSAALLVEGDWTGIGPTLQAVAANIALAWQAHAVHDRQRLRASTHAFARRLTSATGASIVADIIAKRMAIAVGARFAALALPDASARRLYIVATHGYPLELVEHLRIEPGTGIVGGVFESGRTVHRRGPSSAPNGWRRRPRYRTDSFIAMPIREGRESLGVICVSDRLDDQAFTDDDVRVLRALAEPAALALSRERALGQAETFAHAAAVDPLTGVFNRRYFQTRLEEELERSRRHTLSLTLLLLDIDNFKTINDTFGHLAGDAVIKDIAEILRRSVRMFDVCARFGGEEFAIIMPGSNAESVATVAERIRERIESYRSTEPSMTDVRITVSIGIGVSNASMSPRELINRADQALYIAKRDGKNVVRAVGADDRALDANQ
jgi:diguanylate cyclase (GGDEF)-like protein